MKAADLIKGGHYIDSTAPKQIIQYVRPSKAIAGEFYFEDVSNHLPRVLTPKEIETDLTEHKRSYLMEAKTVIDAVNEYKGETFNTWLSDMYITFSHNLFALQEFNTPEYFVCTVEDFNQCVDEMSTNFGTSGDYAEYKLLFGFPSNITLNDKPESIPVYSQAMCDAGELPSVGMECAFDTTFFTTITSNRGTCEIIAYFGGKVWINIIDFDCVINLDVIDFKPLTPPIELINGEVYRFERGTSRGVGFYISRNNAFSSLNNQTPVDECRDIKQLEAKS